MKIMIILRIVIKITIVRHKQCAAEYQSARRHTSSTHSLLRWINASHMHITRVSGLLSYWATLAPNGTYLGLFKISLFFVHFGSPILKSPRVDPTGSQIWHPWSQSGGRVARYGSNVGQIDIKLDQSVIFSDQISVHFGSASQNLLKSDLKISRICPI